MSGGWTIGTPRARRGSSAIVEVTDGDRQARAWCSFPHRDLDLAPAVPVWLDESGMQLSWQPTHWRPAKSLAVPSNWSDQGQADAAGLPERR